MNILDEINYNIWAENVFFDAIASLSDEQWQSKENILNKSIQQIYAHKTEVMWYWFSECVEGKSQEDMPDYNNMSISEMRKSLIGILNDKKKYLEKHTDKDLELNIWWIKQPYKVSAQELIYNGLNHNSYHRGQIAILIRRLDIKLDDVDYNPYMHQKLGLEYTE